jgi:O-antigen/teichoic acid export membrane protein
VNSIGVQRNQLVREGLSVLLGQAGGALGTMLGIRVLTEFVSPEIYGKSALLLGLSALGQAVLCAPLLQAIQRFYPEFAASKNLLTLELSARRYLSVSAILLSGLITMGGLVYVAIGSSFAFLGFVALAGLSFAETLKAAEVALLTAGRRQKLFAVWNVADSIVRPALAVGLIAILGPSPEVIIAGYALAVTVNYSLFRPFSQSNHPIGSKGSLLSTSQKVSALRYSAPLALLAILGWLGNLSSRYVVAAVLGSTEVGLFVAAYSLTSMPFLMAQGVVELTLRPLYFEAVSTANRVLEDRIFVVWLTVVAVLCSGGVLIISFFSEFLAKVLLAGSYRSAARLMPWIALGYAFLAISYVFEKRCYAYKKTRMVLFIQGAGAIVAIPMIYLLTLKYGILGTASSLPCYFGLQLGAAIVVFRYLKRPR